MKSTRSRQNEVEREPQSGTFDQASQLTQFRVATILMQNRFLAFVRPLNSERYPRPGNSPGTRGDSRSRKDYHDKLLLGKELLSSTHRHLSAGNREGRYLVEIHQFRPPRVA